MVMRPELLAVTDADDADNVHFIGTHAECVGYMETHDYKNLDMWWVSEKVNGFVVLGRLASYVLFKGE